MKILKKLKFDDTPEFDEEITSSFNDEKKNNRNQKGKRYL